MNLKQCPDFEVRLTRPGHLQILRDSCSKVNLRVYLIAIPIINAFYVFRGLMIKNQTQISLSHFHECLKARDQEMMGSSYFSEKEIVYLVLASALAVSQWQSWHLWCSKA